MVNSSRFLGSDDGLRLQQQALATVANAGAEANQRTSEGVQQYFKTASDNIQRLNELEQQRYAIEAQNASRPNQFSELVKAGVQIATDIRQQEKAQAAAKQKQQQEIQLSTKYAQLTDDLSNLRAKYDSDNWNSGIEGWNKDTAAVLAKYAPTNPEEAKAWASAVKTVAEAREARSRQVQQKLVETADDAQKARATSIRGQLALELTPQITAIAKEGFNAQAGTRTKAIEDYLDNFLKSDNGLTEAQKLTIVGEYLSSTAAAVGEKTGRYIDYGEKIRNLQDGIPKALDLINQYNTGKLSLEAYTAERTKLEEVYPGLNRFALKPGEKEAIELSLLQNTQARRELEQKGASGLASQLTLDTPAVNALAAAAYLDPTWATQSLENGTLKDSPGVLAAVKLAQRLREYDKSAGRTEVSIAENKVNLYRQNLNSVESIVNFTRQLNLSQAKGQVTPDQQELANTIAQDPRFNDPLVRALINEKLGLTSASTPKLTPQQITQANNLIQSASNQILSQQQALVQTQRNALTQEFQDLFNAGLINPANGQVNRDSLNRLKDSAPTVLDNLNKSRQRLLLETLPQTPANYGVQPNFNQSSEFAPVTDDKGKLLLVPRAQAQVIRLASGEKITTPVLAGSKAPLSNNGHFGAPRTYRNGIHYGQDFALNPGDKAIALVSGQVVHVGKADGYGNFIDILGDNGVVYRYGHQRSFVKVGQRVRPGEPVSTSDGSGVGDYHLHFEVRPNPKFTNGKYDISQNYGQSGAVNPIEHLSKLSAGDSNVLQPRGNYSAHKANPGLKVPGNSTLTSNGGAINGNAYQRPGSVSGQVSQRFSGQRPARTGAVDGRVKVGSVSRNFSDDLGYSELRKDQGLMRAFHQTADRLGVPTEWIVDIVRQESGGIRPFYDHDGNHYGLFGFGSDSGIGNENFRRLRSGQVDGAGQLKLYEKYLSDNGWQKLVREKQGNVTIADLWAFTRLGVRDRQKVWKGDTSLRTGIGNLTYADELKLLGKWVGRQYDLGDRRQRNAAVSSDFRPTCKTCARMQQSGAFAPHVHN